MKRVMKRRLPSAARSAALALVLVMTCLMPARAQSPERVYRLGILALTAGSERGIREVTLPELAKLGFVEGRNLVLDGRSGAVAALPGLASELLATRPDAIITIGGRPTIAMRAATSSVPIVMYTDNPVALGLAASFARPGGNVTGVAIMVLELHGKRLELLLEAAPAVRRVAVLLNTHSPSMTEAERIMRVVAASAGIELIVFTAADAGDYPSAFAAMRAAGAEALVIGSDPRFAADAAPLADFARAARLPTSCEWPGNTRDGCLLGYGPETTALRRRMAHQLARIFRGAAPGEMPIEQPTNFELAINLATARALGLTIPPALLARADEVIE